MGGYVVFANRPGEFGLTVVGPFATEAEGVAWHKAQRPKLTTGPTGVIVKRITAPGDFDPTPAPAGDAMRGSAGDDRPEE
jgi:hypothetical protein